MSSYQSSLLPRWISLLLVVLLSSHLCYASNLSGSNICARQEKYDPLLLLFVPAAVYVLAFRVTLQHLLNIV